MSDCYHDCDDAECSGCLPTDEEVAALRPGRAVVDAHRRAELVGLARGGPERKRAYVLANADEYRVQAAEIRSEP